MFTNIVHEMMRQESQNTKIASIWYVRYSRLSDDSREQAQRDATQRKITWAETLNADVMRGGNIRVFRVEKNEYRTRT